MTSLGAQFWDALFLTWKKKLAWLGGKGRCLGALVLVLGLGAFLFFFRLGDRDLWHSHEGRAAQDAQSLLNEDCAGLPRLFDGQVELQKPPLFYGLVALAAWCQGGKVDAWAVRLPAAVGALGCVLGLFWLGWLRGRWLLGLLAALILATFQHFTALARIGRIDMPLTLAVQTAVVLFYLGECRRQNHGGRRGWPWFLGAYVAVAVAVLLKGPIGLVLPAAVAGGFLLVEGQLPAPWKLRAWWGLFHQLGLWWGILVVLGLATPWFCWAQYLTEGNLFQTFFLYHNLNRALGDGGLRHYPCWFYLPRLGVDLLPWSLLFPVAIWFLFRSRAWRQDPEARLALVWLTAVTVVLSCAGFKRADYLLPAYPGAALLLGALGSRQIFRRSERRIPETGSLARMKEEGESWKQKKPRLPLSPSILLPVLLVVAGMGVGWWFYLTQVLPGEEPRHEFRRFAAEIRRLAPAPCRVVFFRVEAHALAFHVGRPLYTLVEWGHLHVMTNRQEPLYVVMQPDCADTWTKHLPPGLFQEVMRNTDLAGGDHDRPLVLLRVSRTANLPIP